MRPLKRNLLSAMIAKVFQQPKRQFTMRNQADLQYLSELVNEYLETMKPATRQAVGERAQVSFARIALELSKPEPGEQDAVFNPDAAVESPVALPTAKVGNGADLENVS